MKVAIGSDHRGLQLKNLLVPELISLGFSVKDYGTRSKKTCDYPDYAHRVAKAISKQEVDFGILICGTGIGMCIVANKHPNVRAVVCHDDFSTRLARELYDANCLCLAGIANKELVKIWVETKFSASQRFIRQLSKLKLIEGNNNEPK